MGQLRGEELLAGGGVVDRHPTAQGPHGEQRPVLREGQRHRRLVQVVPQHPLLAVHHQHDGAGVAPHRPGTTVRLHRGAEAHVHAGRHRRLLPRPQVPQLAEGVLAVPPGDHQEVAGPVHGPARPQVLVQRLPRLPGRHVPADHVPVLVADDDLVAVHPLHLHGDAPLPIQGRSHHPAGEVDDPEQAVPIRRRQPGPVGGEGDVAHPRVAEPPPTELETALPVPEHHVPLPARRGEHHAVAGHVDAHPSVRVPHRLHRALRHAPQVGGVVDAGRDPACAEGRGNAELAGPLPDAASGAHGAVRHGSNLDRPTLRHQQHLGAISRQLDVGEGGPPCPHGAPVEAHHRGPLGGLGHRPREVRHRARGVHVVGAHQAARRHVEHVVVLELAMGPPLSPIAQRAGPVRGEVADHEVDLGSDRLAPRHRQEAGAALSRLPTTPAPTRRGRAPAGPWGRGLGAPSSSGSIPTAPRTASPPRPRARAPTARPRGRRAPRADPPPGPARTTPGPPSSGRGPRSDAPVGSRCGRG